MFRKAALAAASILAIASCERASDDASTATPPPTQMVDVSVSDELPGLSNAANGISFWIHPTLSFNSLMIVANESGIVSYNIEDGNEVGRIEGIDANGAAIAYYGFGRQAIGAIVTHDVSAGALVFHGIDNASRKFIPLTGGPEIRGAVRDICAGRAMGEISPTVFAVQNGSVQFFTLSPTPEGVSVTDSGRIETPDNLRACAVGHDGVLIVADEAGRIHKLTNEDSFARPFAETGIENPIDIDIVATELAEGLDSQLSTHIIVADEFSGALAVVDGASGALIGAARGVATDELSAIDNASAMGVTSANLGALYRNGAIAFGAGVEAPQISLIPVNGLFNALSLPEGEAVNPRGAGVAQEEKALDLEIGYSPD